MVETGLSVILSMPIAFILAYLYKKVQSKIHKTNHEVSKNN